LTVIACRNNILAADTASWDGDIKIGRVQKIVRLPDGSLVAACGKASLVWGYTDWLLIGAEKPADGATEEDFGAIHLTLGAVCSIDHHYCAVPVEADFYALGSHTEFLYGAMAAGASAEEAVRFALKYCGFAGGEVQVERLEPAGYTVKDGAITSITISNPGPIDEPASFVYGDAVLPTITVTSKGYEPAGAITSVTINNPGSLGAAASSGVGGGLGWKLGGSVEGKVGD
jgi:hypothetical protein